jgi:hypothetical protein
MSPSWAFRAAPLNALLLSSVGTPHFFFCSLESCHFATHLLFVEECNLFRSQKFLKMAVKLVKRLPDNEHLETYNIKEYHLSLSLSTARVRIVFHFSLTLQQFASCSIASRLCCNLYIWKYAGQEGTFLSLSLTLLIPLLRYVGLIQRR